MHAEHLEARFGVGPHTISVPRICSADDIDAGDFPDAISDEIFSKIVAVIRIAVPYTGMIISTVSHRNPGRKCSNWVFRKSVAVRVSSVGGYAEKELPVNNSAQFVIVIHRDIGRGSQLVARTWLYTQFLHSLLSGRKNGRPVYVLSQIRSDSQLLRSECLNDFERIPGRLCFGRYAPKGFGTYSE